MAPSNAHPSDTHADLAAAWRRFIKRIDAVKEATKKITATYETPKPRT